MSTKLHQVKALLQGIREDDSRYDTLRTLLEQQRLCMIRRASDELLAVNEAIALRRVTRQQPPASHLAATSGSERQPCRAGTGLQLAASPATTCGTGLVVAS